MDDRDTLLSVQFPPATKTEPFVEADLRSLSGSRLVGRQGELQFTTKLVFKAADFYRQDQSVLRLWADVRASGQDGVPLPDLGRAIIPDPVFFGPPHSDSYAPPGFDPWTRSVDRLRLDLNFQQLDEIEERRQGGPLTFTFTLGGAVHYDGKVGTLYPANHTLRYEISPSNWQQVLSQLAYGTYVNVEIPLTSPNGLTGDVRNAASALQEALNAFRRGEYEEAVADCRPGLDALERSNKNKFTLGPWDRQASKAERFYWVQRSLLSVTHLAHHPNDPVAASTPPGGVRWDRSDAEAAISILAALIRHRTEWASNSV